jgi:hypothetical protein
MSLDFQQLRVILDDIQEDRVDVSLEAAALIVLLLIGFLELQKRKGVSGVIEWNLKCDG